MRIEFMNEWDGTDTVTVRTYAWSDRCFSATLQAYSTVQRVTKLLYIIHDCKSRAQATYQGHKLKSQLEFEQATLQLAHVKQ